MEDDKNSMKNNLKAFGFVEISFCKQYSLAPLLEVIAKCLEMRRKSN